MIDVDLLVVGSGAAGMTAASTGALLGRSVLLIEKAPLVGGAMAWSGGVAWVPLSTHSAGVDDNRDDVEAYIKGVVGNYFDPPMVEAFLDNGSKMVEFLETHSSAVRFQAFPSPDYHLELTGAARVGRSIVAKPFDGRRLGSWLKLLRRPLPELTVFGGMQVDPGEALHLQHSWHNLKSFNVAAKLIARHAVDRLRYGRGTRMIRGMALAARLLRSAVDSGVAIWTDAAALRLIVEDGRILGAVVQRNGEEILVRAKYGVVLASGGFAADPERMASNIPFAKNHIRLFPETHTGDGIRMAEGVGATLGPANAANAIWAPGSSRRLRDGSVRAYPHFAFDRCKPGAIIVGRDGKRFANEAQSYHRIVERMHELGEVPAWLIADRRFLRRYGMGLARPAPYPVRHLIREGYLIEAADVATLANKIGVSADGLIATVARANTFAEIGIDEDFGKGGDAYTRMLGDPTHEPNPCLGPIKSGPFYALALYGTNAGTTLGLHVDSQARVLDASGTPIQGLFAAGLDMNHVLRGHYPGAGTMIGPAMSFGYLAAKTAIIALDEHSQDGVQ